MTKIRNKPLSQRASATVSQKVFADVGVDLRYQSHTMSDAVRATAVQQGSGASIIVSAINSLELAHEETDRKAEKGDGFEWHFLSG